MFQEITYTCAEKYNPSEYITIVYNWLDEGTELNRAFIPTG